MEKISADQVRKALDELSNFVARQDLVSSLERAAKDKQLLRKAKTNPRAFLEAEGHSLPKLADVTIQQQRAVSGSLTICVRVCRQFGSFVVCVQGCITLSI